MRIVFVHYHAKSGGVTRVMENALVGLSQTSLDYDALVLTGHEPPEDCMLPVTVVEGLGYAEPGIAPDPVQLANRMEELAIRFFGAKPDLWHIHNSTLGKNPSVPDAIVELASRGYSLVLQIHDFAEDGRPANFRMRQSSLQSPSAYPLGERIHYVVLNRRDFRILKQAGIPESHLHWLPNPIAVPEFTEDGKDISTDRPDELIVYPVRAVRRKNFGELLLHATVPGRRRTFVTTLGTTSGDFVDEFRQWENFTSEMGLMVDFAVCERYGFSFSTLIETAHGIVTTSVAEGFGLGFLEPWMYGKTLSGRDLPEITIDFKEMGIEMNQLYERVDIPLEVFRFDEFRYRLRTMMQNSLESYGLDYDDAKAEQWVEWVVNDRQIDYARLDEIAQREVIESIQSSLDLQQKIKDQIDWEVESPELVDRNASIIQSELSVRKYGSRLQELYQELQNHPETGSISGFADGASILSAFIGNERFFPLRT